MTSPSPFGSFPASRDVPFGLTPVAGAPQGLQRLLLMSAGLPAGDLGPVHLHRGDEVFRILGGRILVRVGDQRRECAEGDVVSIPAHTLHGFRTLTATVMEVVAEQGMGTFYPVRDGDGTRRLVEVHRRDLPWGGPVPPGGYTTDEELAAVLAALDADV